MKLRPSTYRRPRGAASDTYQANVIEQLQNGVAAARMPTGTMRANTAFMICARLAHNFKCRLSLLALPIETVRWNWKRFCSAFVYVAAAVIKRARQTHVRLARCHLFQDAILLANQRLRP